MNRFIRLLLYTYIFVASWTLAYKVGNWFSVPNIIVILLIPLYFINSTFPLGKSNMNLEK